MRIAVIGKNIRDSKVPSFIKGLFEKIGIIVKCEVVEFNELSSNKHYLEKLDAVVVLNTFNHEIKECFNTNLDIVHLIRKVDKEFKFYDFSEFFAIKGANNSQAHFEYYISLNTYRCLTGLLDFESVKAQEIYDDIIKLNITDKRMTHILSVCNFGKKINEENHLNCSNEDIEVAALLHDVTKEEDLTVEEAEELGILELPKQAWHSVTGSLRAQNNYGISNQEILDAIRYHTTGRGDMTLLDEIINLSDFCEPTRDYKDCVRAREVALTNYKKGLAIKFERLNELREGSLTNDNIAAYNKYKEYL